MTDPERISPVDALRHLDPEGALSGLDLDDHEGMAIRAALDLWGQSLDPPRTGRAAIREALKKHLVGAGLWPAPMPAAPASSQPDAQAAYISDAFASGDPFLIVLALKEIGTARRVPVVLDENPMLSEVLRTFADLEMAVLVRPGQDR